VQAHCSPSNQRNQRDQRNQHKPEYRLMTSPYRYPNRSTRSSVRMTTVALSGSVNPDHLQGSAERLRSAGIDVAVPEAAFEAWRYFAGEDEARLSALDDVLASDADVVLFTRGGYGLSRILHRIDWQRVAASGKVFCGYSDVTAFSLAALAKASYVTYAGPVLTDVVPQSDDETVRTFALEQLRGVLQDDAFVYPRCASDIEHPPQTIEGTLWGTNLAMVSHLVGTPFMPDIADGILVLEDIAESPYRVERMLWQLKHAGILDRQRAIVLGDFTDCVPSPQLRYPYSMTEAIETLRGMVNCPVLTGFPFGHIAKKVTLPVGGRANLQIDGNAYQMSLLARR
jgi:muramoyltetrapeptide carboxypeptidase